MIIALLSESEIVPKIAVVDGDNHLIGARCLRVSDNALRFYRLEHMKADGGIQEIMAALDALPKSEAERWSA